MNRFYISRSKYILLFVTLITFSQAFGRKDISETDKIVFVYTKHRSRNLIVIPNFRRTLYKFRIYRKLKSEAEFSFVAEKKRPAIPFRANRPGPSSVHWEDPDYHSHDLDYKIICYDKKGNNYGEMEQIWEGEDEPRNVLKTPEEDTVK